MMKYTILFLLWAFLNNVQGMSLNRDLMPDTLPIASSVVIDMELFGYFSTENGSKSSESKKQDVSLTSSLDHYFPLLELGFRMKKDLSCYPDFGEIEKLANAMKLTTETQYNPKCVFDIGDLTSWSQKGLSVDQLILEFVTRRIVLEALDEVGFTIVKRNRKENSQGICSTIAKEFQGIPEIQDQWIMYLGQYKECKKNKTTISFPINDKVISVKSFRINEAKKMILNAPKGEYSQGYISRLATYYELPGFGGKYDCNPALWFSEDDLNYFFEKYENDEDRVERINKEFAARWVVIDGADLDNSPCFRFYNLGEISWVAETFIIPKL